MPHAKHHKARTRQRIVRSAQRLFTLCGYEGTTIEQIMQACALTRGGFYAHFRSKAHLYAEAIGHVANADLSPPATVAQGDWLDALFDACALPPRARAAGHDAWQLLASDVASDNPAVRAGYGRLFKRLTLQLHGEHGATHGVHVDALATAAMIVGALAVASSIDDRSLRLRVIDACRQRAHTLREHPDALRHELLWAVDRPHTRTLPPRPVH